MPPFFMQITKKVILQKEKAEKVFILFLPLLSEKRNIHIPQVCGWFKLCVKKETANHLVCGLDVSDMIRTRDLLIRSQTLYPAELHSHIRFEQNL